MGVGAFISEDPIKDGLNWYAYCMNNPVSLWDFWGTVAYEHFANILDAAEDWAWNYYGKTDYTLFEFGSVMFSATDENGELYYSYTWAMVGTPHTVASMNAADMIPIGAGIEGTIHSHPHGYELSDQDKQNAKNFEHNYTFVVVPTADRTVALVRGITAGSGNTYNYAYVKYNPVSTADRPRLFKLLYNEWHAHYYNEVNKIPWCNKAKCADINWPRQ